MAIGARAARLVPRLLLQECLTLSQPRHAPLRRYATFKASDLVPETHKRSFGQPTVYTHPHLLVKGQVTPGISVEEYARRRSALMQSLPNDSVVISMGYSLRYMTNNIFYPFHQHTDFWYLCGFNEPDAALIMTKDSSDKGYRLTMFVPPKSTDAELWEGPRTGPEATKELFHADEAYDNTLFSSHVRDVLQAKHVFADSPGSMPTLLRDKSFTELGTCSTARSFFSWINPAGPTSQSILPLTPLVQELRAVKSKHEIDLMKDSGSISAASFTSAMKWTKPGYTEAQLWAKLDYECRMRGSTMLAYVPVVAGGPNALSMHYVRNDMPLRDGDLVLVDAGGEYKGYASDITRTWPVNGKFTRPQRELYEAVLDVNKQCIKMCTEKTQVSLNQIHAYSVKRMKEHLGSLGFGSSVWDLERILYPHHVGHYLGLDVHDVANVSRSRKLKKNMVVTIEPGLYVPFDDRFPRQYQGIGIRIEDNVVIGSTEPYVLTSSAPKEVVDIEYCCAK